MRWTPVITELSFLTFETDQFLFQRCEIFLSCPSARQKITCVLLENACCTEFMSTLGCRRFLCLALYPVLDSIYLTAWIKWSVNLGENDCSILPRLASSDTI